MVRVALVGIGDAGKHHARALLGGGVPGAELSALVVRDASKGAAFRAELRVPPGARDFPSLEALLEARACDAVVLATPDGAHAEQVERVAAHGLAVLVEKPLALTAESGARAIEAAQRANVHLQVGYQLRYHPAHRRMLTEQRERIGAVRTIYLRWAWPDPAVDGWRAQGRGARFWSLAALGTHCIDLALLFGGAPLEWRVAALREPASGIDRGAEVSFTLAGGAMAHVSVAVTHRAVSRLLVTGDAGELEALGTLGARGEGELWHRPPRGPAMALPFEPEKPYVNQLKAFVERARSGFTPDPSLLANLTLLDQVATTASPELA